MADADEPRMRPLAFRELPKPVGEMSDEELTEFAGEMADEMIRAREEQMKRDGEA